MEPTFITFGSTLHPLGWTVEPTLSTLKTGPNNPSITITLLLSLGLSIGLSIGLFITELLSITGLLFITGLLSILTVCDFRYCVWKL